jgi:hypothetical protein
MNGVVTCTGNGFGANCFVNPVNGMMECPTANLTSGCNALLTASTVECVVPILSPSQTTVFTIPIRANVTGGVVSGSATVDPDSFVAEADEANNRVSFTVDSVLGISGGAPSVGSAPVAPAPPPVVGAVVEPPTDAAIAEAPAPAPPVAEAPMPEPPVAITPPEVPAEVAGAQAPLWLNILRPTDAFSVVMEPLWTAQPGEWYEVRLTEVGWALVIWEYHTAADQQWIELDTRVSALNIDRETPPTLFLQIQSPTPAYGSDMEPLWVAQPGENYAILEVEDNWALALWEHDSPEWQVWIELDPSVAVVLLP